MREHVVHERNVRYIDIWKRTPVDHPCSFGGPTVYLMCLEGGGVL
jgi:hypothetical protein